MLDSPRPPVPHSLRATSLTLLLATLLCLAGGAAGLTARARADGDPASDVLATQPLFLSQDAQFSPAAQEVLAARLNAAQRDGVPLRVAVIASSSDLGSVTELWRQPENYARFLDQELGLVYRGPLVVVMPNGLGVAGAGRLAPAQRAVLASAVAGAARASAPPGPQLQRVTQATVRRWLTAGGVSVIVGVAAAPSTGTNLAAIAVFVLGAALVALCWTLSLRARPPGSRARSSVNP